MRESLHTIQIIDAKTKFCFKSYLFGVWWQEVQAEQRLIRSFQPIINKQSKHLIMNRRALLFNNVRATGLNPKEAAEQRQPIQIYHPQSQKYVMVGESSPKLSESESNFVCVDESYKGGGKLFLLEQIGNNDYHIKCMDNDGENEIGFLYVSEHVSSGVLESSANVLRSEKIAHKKDQYIFQFFRHSEQKGVYRIKCKENAKLLFGSDDRGNYVKADRRDREKSNQIWFQLCIKPHMDINVKVMQTNNHVLSGSEDSPMYIDEVCNGTTYPYTQTYQDGVDRLINLLEKTGLNEDADLKADSELFALQSTTSPFTIHPGKETSFSSAVSISGYLIEQQLEIEFQGKKFEGYNIIKVSAGSTKSVMKEDQFE